MPAAPPLTNAPRLLFTDPKRLPKIATAAGGLQILYAGKAHPQDEPGKALIQEVIETRPSSSNDVLRIVYLENYAWDLGALSPPEWMCG